jgi:phytanoyl-CoA hydroxylase
MVRRPLRRQAGYLELPERIMTSTLAESFERDGFVVVPNFKSKDEIAALRARAEEIVDAFDPSVASGIFSTRDESVKNDDYFLGSATTVRCFFEEEAFDETGALRRPKGLSINKIGHAMHDLDPVFAEFSHGPKLDALVRELGTVTTLWFALERADRNNGCLWIAPAGHRGPLRERFSVNGEGPHVEHLDATPWPEEGAVPIEVDAGTLVVFNGLLPHYSAPNRSPASRHAYTLHVVDGRARYAQANWLQRPPEFPARGFV